jgi:hypothetical protein
MSLYEADTYRVNERTLAGLRESGVFFESHERHISGQAAATCGHKGGGRVYPYR